MLNVTRRRFFSACGAGAAAAAIAPLVAQTARAAQGTPAFGRGFGALNPKLPLNADALPSDLRGVPLLALPEGFEYTAVSITGQTMSDGNAVPAGHDGMAAFRGPHASTILVRNHELRTSPYPVLVAGGTPYDSLRQGGTTTLVIGPKGELVSDYGSLTGTERNCAGGPTPWGTWLTCEETFGETDNARHGYVFEVPAGGVVADPEPLTAMGRFNHEAAAVDPATSFVYQTEDRGDSLFYRYIPAVHSELAYGGSLWALRLKDWPAGIDTRSGFRDLLNLPLAADWVRIDEPDPATDTVRAEGRSKGAAVFSRGEGAWYGNGFVYFVCSNGGDAGRGQVFAYDPAAETVTLVFEAVPAADLGDTDPSWTDDSVADNGGFVHAAPDNITVGPDGRLYLCEDGSGVEKVVGINHAGQLFEVARNEINGSEFCGACFSHDGRFMFLNMQSPGITFAIRGNWRQGQR
ncbi:MAG: DUF839 domain-containing protein [Gammaproteobacteria bacterium]|nr:DUF839 domain-containing protein [Gammaproteobacteria bacterium]